MGRAGIVRGWKHACRRRLRFEGMPEPEDVCAKAVANGSGTPARPEARLQGLSSFLPALLSVREAAERLRVSSATVYALCERGELRHVRVSNAIQLRVEDLEDFIRRAGR